MAKLAEDKAADGVVVILLGQLQAQALVDLVDVDFGQGLGYAVAEGANPVDQFLVVLVDDFADDFLQDVLHGNQPGDAPVFVQHHRHVVSRVLELLQQDVHRFGFGHEVGIAQQRGPGIDGLAASRGQFGQQVLGIEDAHDVVAVLLKDRDPRVARLDHELEHLLPGKRQGDRDHVGAGHHDLGNRHVAQLDHPLDHLPGVLLQQALAMALGDDRADLVLERLFVGDFRRAAGQAVQHGADESGPEHRGCQTEADRAPDRPGVVDKRRRPQPDDGPGDPDLHGQEHRRAHRGADAQQGPVGWSPVIRRPPDPEDHRTDQHGGRDHLEGLGAQGDQLVPPEDLAEPISRVVPPADLLQLSP